MNRHIERNPRFEFRGEDQAQQKPPKSGEESEREAAERLEEIHQYLRDQYARRVVVTTTVTPGGQRLDWVPVESQVSDGRIADPPEEDRPYEPRDAGERRAEPVQFELELEGAERGPEGTVPLVRTPIERIRTGKSLNDWLAKGGYANRLLPADAQFARAYAPGLHHYAATAQVVTCYGTEGFINVWKPFVQWSEEFSLGQLAVARGIAVGRQTVEAGWQVRRESYGDWEPHLFVFFTTNGHVQQGNNVGGYNTDVTGWVQTSNVIFPKALCTASQFDLEQKEIEIKVALHETGQNWWIRVKGSWMGYYPSSLFNDVFGLKHQADEVHWYGEVFDSDAHPGMTMTDMGSGYWPYEGWGRCAYMRNLLYQSGLTTGQMTPYNGVPWSSDSDCYGVDFHVNDPNWGSYLWWGGPGQNGACP